MSLRNQLSRWVETFSDIALSAEERFGDARELMIRGRHRGAVYLFGLASEMWLKLASYRLLGARASDPVGHYAHIARQFMDNNAMNIPRQPGHDLNFWGEFLILRRSQGAAPLSRVQAGQLRHHIMNRLYEDWEIQLRYRPAAVSPGHARRVFADAAWIRDNWENLAR